MQPSREAPGDPVPAAAPGAGQQAGRDPRAPSAALIEVAGLQRFFGARHAVAGVDFSLRAGQCLAVFGPNGAGKTTLLRVLAGLLKPSAGRAAIAGVDLPGGPAARATIGMISHHSMLYDALTARENLEFTARLYGLADPRASAAAALQRMRIDDRADTTVRAMSRGMQQRVSIARAVVHSPRVVLLDEPYSGLDEVGSNALSTLLAELLAAGAAMVIVTHNLGEGLSLATHTAIMREGRFARYEARGIIDVLSYAATYREVVTSGA
jgi:heme exporter protein A